MILDTLRLQQDYYGERYWVVVWNPGELVCLEFKKVSREEYERLRVA